MLNEHKNFCESDIPRPTWENSESKKNPICSFRRLSLLEEIILKLSCAVTRSSENKCGYDHSELIIYKAFVKRIPPKNSKDFGLSNWFLFGECRLCGNLYTIVHHMNTY